MDGKLCCTGASCSHYGLPLVKGVPTKGRVTCAFHDAEFDLKTGTCVNGPALNNIPVYEVAETHDGKAFVLFPENSKKSVVPKMVSRDPSDKRVFVVVGGGAVAIAAVETLRQTGFTGTIKMISAEQLAPYDRCVLSKNVGTSEEKLVFRNLEFLRKTVDVDFIGGRKVTKVDLKKNAGKKTFVVLDNGEKVAFDKLLLATGTTPRQLPLEGSNCKNILTLRTPADSDRISKYAQKGVRVAVIGSSFIGMEVASSMAKKGATVTVIGQSAVPFQKVLGERVGKVIAKLFRENGVTVISNSTVTKYRTAGDAVNGVELNNGDVIQADVVVLGIGGAMETGYLDSSPEIERNGQSVKVDALLKTSVDDVYAAGDIAEFPYFITGDRIRVEHWDVAMQHGRVAAKNMMQQFEPYKNVPFFSSMFFGKSVRYAGYAADFDEVLCEGDVEKYTFVAYYIKNNKICAVASMGRDPIAVGVCEAFKQNLMPSVEEVRIGAANADSILRRLKDNCKRTVSSVHRPVTL
eukprot:GHVS01031316.1.p1 GENE.GHVS01031316.1~~GHVS01031316.1.p1  ORF type:complete len:520 (+),score=96.44 GHVS01031316.1:401-1960(+)